MQIVYSLQWLSVQYPPNLLGIIKGFSASMFYFIVNVFKNAYTSIAYQNP